MDGRRNTNVQGTNPFTPLIMDMDRVWWREVIIYEIYVQSFQDSNGDGIGDIPGVIQRLDYLKHIGIDMIWLTPVYKSPLRDAGYDISDHKAINKIHGTMDDWDRLVEEVHKRGMKIMMDMVFNHTSDEHEWFKESRSHHDNPKRDWYFWRKGKIGPNGEHLAPNNWMNFFGGSAWQHDHQTDEWYLHLFDSSQPDLNWDNPEVRDALFDIIRFWADKGTDGFRFDVINCVSKVPGLPDAPIVDPTRYEQPAVQLYTNGPNIHSYVHEMNEKALSLYNCCSVGEVPCGMSEYEASEYVGKDRRELSMIFQYHHMELDATDGDKWNPKEFTLPELGRVLRIWQQHMLGNHGWISFYLENHDQPRSLARFATEDPKYRSVAAKMLGTLLLTMRGTIYIYQGQELGMPHPEDFELEDFKDVETQQFYHSAYEKRKMETPEGEPDMSDVFAVIHKKARDNVRTPMQWDTSPNCGFCKKHVQPWMRPNTRHTDLNVCSQERDPDSVLNYYRKLILLRKQNPLFFYGAFVPINPQHLQIFSFIRAQGLFRLLVVCNFSSEEALFEIPNEIDIDLAVLIVANYHVDEMKLEYKTTLRPWEARVYTLRN